MLDFNVLVVAPRRAGLQRSAMRQWRELHADFMALGAEESRLVRQTAPPYWMCVYGEYREASPYGQWNIAHSISENLRERFELSATEAGILLGVPAGVSPASYWFHRLFLYLREKDSRYLGGRNEKSAVIEHLCEASATYCARLQINALEATVGALPEETHALKAEQVAGLQHQQQKERMRQVGTGGKVARKRATRTKAILTSSPRKGDVTLLASKRAVNFSIAEQYLGIKERHRQMLIKKGSLEVEGKGHNRKITVESLLKYLPAENPH